MYCRNLVQPFDSSIKPCQKQFIPIDYGHVWIIFLCIDIKKLLPLSYLWWFFLRLNLCVISVIYCFSCWWWIAIRVSIKQYSLVTNGDAPCTIYRWANKSRYLIIKCSRCCKFSTKWVGRRILKIGQHSAKIVTKIGGLLFGPPCCWDTILLPCLLLS